MGGRAVLENIGYFLFELVPRAECGAPWTLADLQSALGWADYSQHAARAAAAGSPAHGVLTEYVRRVGGRHRPDLDVAALLRARQLLLAALLQNHRLSEQLLAAVVQELRRAEALDECVAQLVQTKQTYLQLTAAVSRGARRCRLEARLSRRYLTRQRFAGRDDAWLRRQTEQLAAGAHGGQQVALALAAADEDPDRRVDAALEERLGQISGDWTQHLDERELRRLLRRPGVTAALLRTHFALPPTGDDGDSADALSPQTSAPPWRRSLELLLQLAARDPSGRLRRQLLAKLAAGGARCSSYRRRLAAQMPRFRLRCSDEPPS